MDPENHYREKIMLYISYRESEYKLNKNEETWTEAYFSHKNIIDVTENQFSCLVTPWGDIENSSTTIAFQSDEIFMLHFPLETNNRDFSNEKYDIQQNLQEKMQLKNTQTKYTKDNEFIKHPFVLDTLAYHEIMKQLNQEQQSVIKQIVLWKKNNPGKRFYLFITRGASTRKTFTAQALYHALVHLYNKD